MTCLRPLHASGRIHGDIKPLNIMRDFRGRWVLIDLDASARIGVEAAGVKLSEAYCCPQVARHALVVKETDPDAAGPVAHPAMDVWGVGVVLYELLTGRQLFPRDARTDRITTELGRRRLCMWLCADEEVLAHIVNPTARHLVACVVSAG